MRESGEKIEKMGEAFPPFLIMELNVSYKVLGWYIKPYPIQNYQKLQIQTLLQGESRKKNKKQRKKSKSQKKLEQCSKNSGRLAGKHPF